MKPYPWREEKDFSERRFLAKVATKVAKVITVVSAIISLGVAYVVGFLAVRQFTRRNDSWLKRGAIMAVLGLVVFVALGSFPAYIDSIVALAQTLGTEHPQFVPLALGVLLHGIPLGIGLQGLSVIGRSYSDEVEGNRFLERVKPTRAMKRRRAKNIERISKNEEKNPDTLTCGVVKDDPIPWRTERYGMVCSRPLRDLGHGIVAGGTGTGKTVFGTNLANTAAGAGWPVFYIDFKASLRTLNRVRDLALRQGKKFYSFDLGVGSNERSWYDPLDWKGEPSDKAAMLVNSFNFEEQGAASYFRGIASDWLTLQFEVMDAIGIYEGESCFDYLYDTSSPERLKNRLRALKGKDDRYTVWHQRASEVKADSLSALRTNLSTVVNAGGRRLRPQSDAPAILMARAAEEGAVVYFGLSPSTNEVALKIIGSLIIRNLGVLAGERMRSVDVGTLVPLLAIVDEASRLGHRAVVMETLFATAREGEVYVWPLTQSFATWPESTVVEMNTNVQTHVAFRVQDKATAEQLESTLDEVPVRKNMTEGSTEHRGIGRGDVSSRSGDTRRSIEGGGAFLTDAPYSLTSLPNMFAYIWFAGEGSANAVMTKKDLANLRNPKRRALLGKEKRVQRRWKPKRLPMQDVIVSDAPLVEVIFMDMTPPEEQIEGQSFVDMVTPPEQITKALEKSSLKRTRETGLTENGSVLPPIPMTDYGYPQDATPAWGDGDDDAGQWSDGIPVGDDPTLADVGPQWGAEEPPPDEPQWGDLDEPGYGAPSEQGNEPLWSDGPAWDGTGPAPDGRDDLAPDTATPQPHTSAPQRFAGHPVPPDEEDDFAPDTATTAEPARGPSGRGGQRPYTGQSASPGDANAPTSGPSRRPPLSTDAEPAPDNSRTPGDHGNAAGRAGAEGGGTSKTTRTERKKPAPKSKGAASDWE